jgi:uncharacterized protein (DUF433 family)
MVLIECKPALRRLSKRWIALSRATDVVVSDPEIRGGEPVIRGTRIPVYLIADLLDRGAELREILEDYPSLNAGKIRSALAYAHTHPRRGRPRSRRIMSPIVAGRGSRIPGCCNGFATRI